MRRRTITAGLVGASLTLFAASPLVGHSAPSAAELGKKISKTQSKVNAKKSKETVLTRDIAKYTTRVNSLETRLKALSTKQGTLEQDLSAKRTALNQTQDELRSERERLVRLQRRLREARSTLSLRVVDQYKNGRPDLATILIEANGMSQVLERGELLGRLAKQDQNIISAVRTAKKEATGLEEKLSSLEAKQQKTTAIVAARRDQIARIRGNVASVTSSVRDARNGKRALLSSVKVERKNLEEDLSKMQEQQAKISGALAGAGNLAPAKRGNGQFVWPVNGTITSPFCESRSWENCHPGIDIAVPTGTPIHAADAGRIAIAGWVGGYGNYICIQHTKSLSTCYGHQSKLLTTVGQSVRQGQIIGLSGSTGHSTGPHVHFEVRINGAVTNPMNYL
jgi:murein DD-endopeptidase MepM/ murein hydrolase activator NlpD